MLTSHERNVLVATRIAVILGLLSVSLLLTLTSLFGVNINTPLIAGMSIFFFLVAYLNGKGFYNIGRILLCVLPPILTLIAALLAKTTEPTFTDVLYYDARFFMILFTIVPCLIFDTSEKLKLYGSLGVIASALLLFDPVHEYFDVGYYQRGFESSSYYYINYAAGFAFLGIAAGAISLKLVIERAEKQNDVFKSELQDTNARLSEALSDLEAQNYEIVSQREELYTSQDQLLAANKLIEKQKVELQKQVNQINSDLQEANEELIKRNNELQQFSYTISHNLRGPIARLLGLAHLAKATAKFDTDEEATTIINHIETSAAELDTVIRDLNSIVEVRNNIYELRQPIDFSNEWKEVRRLLNISDEMEHEQFKVDFSAAPTLHTVKPMIHSIFINLISNSLKFRSPERTLRVNINTYENKPFTVLEVADNGVGIDLQAFENDIFKMYKKFNHHQEGKGLGLYLVKSQAEMLNGFVEVKSTLGKGTTFKVHIKKSADLAV